MCIQALTSHLSVHRGVSFAEDYPFFFHMMCDLAFRHDGLLSKANDGVDKVERTFKLILRSVCVCVCMCVLQTVYIIFSVQISRPFFFIYI